LRNGYCRSTSQDAGQQEKAAGFVTEPQGNLLASDLGGGGGEEEYPIAGGYFWQMDSSVARVSSDPGGRVSLVASKTGKAPSLRIG
jgi:hypothetical protein